MKGKRRLFGVLLIIAALIIMQLPVSEADAATSASDFKIEGSTLVKYCGDDTEVKIPNTVEIIGEGAFEENDYITTVVVPDSVTSIEPYAFWGCDNLSTVTLGTGLKEIGAYSFANCKGLKQMNIPKTIRSIGLQAFVDCVNMTDITIPPEVTDIHESAFDGCYKLYIHCTAGSFADEYAQNFYVKQEEMPEYEDVQEHPDIEGSTDLEEQGDSVVYEPTPGRLLGSTQIVGNSALVFMEDSEQYIVDGAQSMAGESVENELQSTQVGTIPKYTIVDGKIIADQAYYRAKGLGHIVLPDGIEEIGLFAFSRSSVASIVIPKGTKEIRYGAFYHCDNLAKVFLPDSIENVEPKAFSNTLWVRNFEANGIEDFLISGNVLIAYRGITKEIVIPEGVTVIAGEVFKDNTQLTSVTLPESLVTIGEGAFEGCKNLTTVISGSQLSKIKDRAFAGCPLGKISLGEAISEVGLMAFDKEVQVIYSGESTPISSHELSAERLSNEKYRPVVEESQKPGVYVEGMDGAFASLEGANRAYTLSITEASDQTAMEAAYQRSYQSSLPENMTVYDIQLTDNSGILLTKLGKQKLSVTIPVAEQLTGKNIIVYALDRNGQLERLNAERVQLDGRDAVRFQTAHLSLFGICGDGSISIPADVVEVSTTIQSMSQGPAAMENTTTLHKFPFYLKWSSGLIFLFLGLILITGRGRKEE